MKYLFVFMLSFFLLSTNGFAKKKNKTNSVTINTNRETLKLGGLLGNYDGVIFSDSINKDLIFTATPQGIYYLKDSVTQIAKGRFGTIDIQPIYCNQSTIIGTSIKGDNTIRIYQWNSINQSINEISAGDIPSGVDDIIGLKIVTGNQNTTDKLVILGKRGQIEVWELFLLSWGQLDARVIETTTLPERCNSLNYYNQTLAGTYENKGAWIVPLMSNGKLGIIKNINAKAIKFPLFGSTQFEYNYIKYMAFTQRDSSFLYIMNLETQKISPAIKIYHEGDMKTIQNPQFVLYNKDNKDFYILDYHNTQNGKADGSNFKIIHISQLKSVLEKLSN